MSRPRPVLFGEVLFDRFPSGEAVLGGAPFNVAWHLQAFGLEPLFVSGVGDDALGRDVLEAMGAWGMDVSGVQVDGAHATGSVEVRFEGGEPVYDILADRAYDHVRAEHLPAVASGALLCHGTLALRAPASRAALEQLVRTARPRRLVDVNLRPPWCSTEGVLAAIRGAAFVKLNEAELAQLVGAQELETAARALLGRCGAERLVVTRGARGALAVERDGGTASGAPGGAAEVVDTVGAGDAFTSVLMLGESRGWKLATSLVRGLEFAEGMVGVRGATTADRSFYTPFLKRWEL